MPEIEMVTIPNAEYEQLIKDQKWLLALEAAGVGLCISVIREDARLPQSLCRQARRGVSA